MKKLVRKYHGKPITFLLDSVDDNVMVNATDMAKHFNGNVHLFFKHPQTKAFVDIMLNDKNLRKNDPKNKIDSVIQNLDNGQIYIHQLLAVDFARTLGISIRFWISTSITAIWQDLLEESIEEIEFLEQQLKLDQ